jgi:hypothetical protein
MKLWFVAVCAALLAVPFAGADDGPAVPESVLDTQIIIKDTVRTAQKIKTVDKNIADVNERGEALAKRIEAHNAEHPDGCEYPEDNPHACDGWVAEADTLNTTLRELVAEYRGYRDERATLMSHLAVQRARLRLTPFLDSLTSWEQEVVECARIPSIETAVGCLNDAWERHP